MSAHGRVLTGVSTVRIVENMGTTIKIAGAIDRSAPSPAAPSDPFQTWIGNVSANWVHDGAPRSTMAAVTKMHTGQGMAGAVWGPHTLVLRWIGDPPSPEIAQAVYDFLFDRGPSSGAFDASVDVQPGGDGGEPSYRRIRPAFPGMMLVPT